MKLADFPPYLALNVLLKGEPGTGKTPAALSFPYPLLFFDCDFRANSLLNFFKYDKERLKEIEVIQPNHFDDVKLKLERIYEQLSGCPYRTIALDTLTTYSDISIRGAMREKGGSGGRKIGTVLIPGLQDYGDESGILNEVMTLLRLIYKKGNVNTILVAHVITTEEKGLVIREKTDPQEEKPKIPPPNVITYSRSLLTAGRKIGAKLPSYFDEVYHMAVRAGFNNPEFTCYTRHTGFDFARTGLDCPPEIDFTNWERIPDRYFYSILSKYLPDSEGREKYERSLEEEDKIERQEVIQVVEGETEHRF